MRIGGADYTREQILERVGNLDQMGGTRHCALEEGRARGVRAIEFSTGSGLCFTALPDRGLDISRAAYKGVNLAYLTPNGEVHPSYYEPQGPGWLRTFFGGLVTTCGLTYLGAPGRDGDEDLGLHGRYATSPARRVCDRSGWDGDEYRLEVTGCVEECALFGHKVRLTRTISTRIGSRSLKLDDVAENFGHAPAPFTILYHVNAGFPLLDASSRLALGAAESSPCSEKSARGRGEMLSFSAPRAGFVEENFLHRMAADAGGKACAAMINPDLGAGLGLYLRFDAATLPYLNEWKMMGQGDYVVGIEPCNAPCENRAALREKGMLPHLAPAEKREMRLEIGILEGKEEIDSFLARLEA